MGLLNPPLVGELTVRSYIGYDGHTATQNVSTAGPGTLRRLRQTQPKAR
jgi:hypothetical protein